MGWRLCSFYFSFCFVQGLGIKTKTNTDETLHVKPGVKSALIGQGAGWGGVRLGSGEALETR